jgi:uncharacterized protein (DUF58 family)
VTFWRHRSGRGPEGSGRGPRRWRWTTWPRRTLWPTRDGWWCLGAAIGLGFAAMNTGNNLLYVLVSMLLGVIIVSGVLSEQSIRGLDFFPLRPDEVFAGRPALFGIRVVNRKRWRASYSIAIDVLDEAATTGAAFVPRLPARAEALVSWEAVPAGRGRRPFPALRVSTRFPFGLFVKAGRVALESEMIVYPAVRPLAAERLAALGVGGAAARRRGRGGDLHNLREYRPGDEPRLIHWRSSAKTGDLLVRELEVETALDTTIVLSGTGTDRERVEAGVSEAASLASHLLATGARVELVGTGLHVPLARGREQRQRVLTALALYEPAGDHGTVGTSARAGAREIRIAIG